MATYGWRAAASVADWLLAQGYRFDFYQAVRLLEMMRPDAVPIGEGPDPEREAVRFLSKVDLNFPQSDVEQVRGPRDPADPASQPEMVVRFMGLAGAMGPLPQPVTELIMERAWHKDTALRDFLDVFNHRLISLMYRVRKKHRLGLTNSSPEDTRFASYLYALSGILTPGLRGRMQVPDRALLHFTGLLSQRPRSMTGLTTLLGHFFGFPVTGRQFRGAWQSLDEDQVCRIGLSGQNQCLSQDTVLGTRIWDQHAAFTLSLGPLQWPQFLELLPGGDGYRAVCELVRFYVGPDLHFFLRLIVSAGSVRPTRLSARSGPLLSFTSFLSARKFRKDAEVEIAAPGEPDHGS